MKNDIDTNNRDRDVLLIVGDDAYAEIVGDFCHITRFQRIPGMIYAEREDMLYRLKWLIHIDTATHKWRIRSDHHLAEWSEWKDF